MVLTARETKRELTFAWAIFRAAVDSRCLFFAHTPHRNFCYAGELKRNLMPSNFSQPIYPSLPSNVTDIFSTGENKGFHFSFCEGNLKNCKLKVSFLIRRIIIHVSSLLIFEKQTSTLFVHLLLFISN